MSVQHNVTADSAVTMSRHVQLVQWHGRQFVWPEGLWICTSQARSSQHFVMLTWLQGSNDVTHECWMWCAAVMCVCTYFTSQEQYMLVHEVLLAYMESFTSYSNFKQVNWVWPALTLALYSYACHTCKYNLRQLTFTIILAAYGHSFEHSHAIYVLTKSLACPLFYRCVKPFTVCTQDWSSLVAVDVYDIIEWAFEFDMHGIVLSSAKHARGKWCQVSTCQLYVRA